MHSLKANGCSYVSPKCEENDLLIAWRTPGPLCKHGKLSIVRRNPSWRFAAITRSTLKGILCAARSSSSKLLSSWIPFANGGVRAAVAGSAAILASVQQQVKNLLPLHVWIVQNASHCDLLVRWSKMSLVRPLNLLRCPQEENLSFKTTNSRNESSFLCIRLHTKSLFIWFTLFLFLFPTVTSTRPHNVSPSTATLLQFRKHSAVFLTLQHWTSLPPKVGDLLRQQSSPKDFPPPHPRDLKIPEPVQTNTAPYLLINCWRKTP